MKQQVLKALANPPHLFYVPYNLAIINFAVQFVVFITLYVISMVVFGTAFTSKYCNPLFFLISVIIVHMILANFTKRDIQLGQILVAKISMIKSKIPRRLTA